MSLDEEAEKIIGNKNLYDKIEENISQPSKNASEETPGALNNICDIEKENIDPARRKTITSGLIALIASQFTVPKLALSVSTSSLAVSTLSLSISNQNLAQTRKSDWKINRGLASKIGQLTYDSPEIGIMRQDRSLNTGEAALLDSFIYHRNCSFYDLSNNLTVLHRASEENDDISTRSLILSRIAIDNNALSDGESAQAALAKIDFSGIVDQGIREMVLDNTTAAIFNCLNEKNLKHLAVFLSKCYAALG